MLSLYFFPVETLVKNIGYATAQKNFAYQQRVGLINFAATIIRLDMADFASKFLKYLINLSSHHLNMANCALNYLVGSYSLAV